MKLKIFPERGNGYDWKMFPQSSELGITTENIGSNSSC